MRNAPVAVGRSTNIVAESEVGMNKNQKAFEGYQKQAAEKILRYQISAETYQQACTRAGNLSANSMQQRIEQIAHSVR
ncbi:MAG: hypothetical protein WC365_07150 [Candidatus Babeliales bacterium]|jgi:hypothetical protein